MEAGMAAALITDELYARLIANGARSAAGEDIDPRPSSSSSHRTLAPPGFSPKLIPKTPTVCSASAISALANPNSAMSS